MQLIYELIQKNPQYSVWIFGAINLFWCLFVYFNKQRHETNLKKLEQNLRYRADRRLKIFEKKANEYAKYVADLDNFGRKNQIELPNRMQPIYQEYLHNYLEAQRTNNLKKEHQTIAKFLSQVSILAEENIQDILKLKRESNRLKLIATDEMLQTFQNLENLTQEAMEYANEYMKNFHEIMQLKSNEKTMEYQKRSSYLASKIKEKSNDLLMQMRQELNDI